MLFLGQLKICLDRWIFYEESNTTLSSRGHRSLLWRRQQGLLRTLSKAEMTKERKWVRWLGFLISTPLRLGSAQAWAGTPRPASMSSARAREDQSSSCRRCNSEESSTAISLAEGGHESPMRIIPLFCGIIWPLHTFASTDCPLLWIFRDDDWNKYSAKKKGLN